MRTGWVHLCLVVVIAGATNCSLSTGRECLRQSDCPPGELCRMAECRPARDPISNDAGADVPVRTGRDGGVDGATDAAQHVPCPDYRAPGPGDLVINELLADPPDGPAGDANGDGVRDASDDEFVEIVNGSGAGLYLGGVTLLEGSDPAHNFQATCLAADEAVVLWGGVLDGAALPEVTGVRATVASGSFSLTNGGGRLELRSAAGGTIDAAAWSGGPSEAQTRSPELTGDAWVAHSEAAGAEGAPFSPGTCADGGPFGAGCPEGP
jgi:hypothetical protein